MIRALLFCLLTVAPLPAEMVFSVVRDGTETPAAPQVQLAPTAAGETLDTLFRLRNTGKTNSRVTAIAIGGTGFAVTNLPDFPASLAPDGYLDFIVRFQPSVAASYSAVLKSDGVQIFVLATGLAAAKVYVEENGSRRPLDTTTGLDFGAIERGTEATRRIVLVNESDQVLTPAVTVADGTFRLASGPAGTVVLQPLQVSYADIVYAPVSAGPQRGELRIDTRRFPLFGTTLEPPLPKPIVTIDLKGSPPGSGQQPLADVWFDPAPRTSGAGRLRIDFHPSVDAGDDPAILFVATASRSIDFSIIENEPNAQFGSAVAVPFQTGTTAGKIVLTAQVGDWAETASLEIPQQPVVIESVLMTRTASSVDVQVSGFDNTRSLTAASFTFLQKDGTALPPGTQQQDLAAAFKNYFAGSSEGGTFQLKLSFPVTGGTAAIDSVQVVMTNAAGQTSWPAAR
jgi:hypothetical protein